MVIYNAIWSAGSLGKKIFVAIFKKLFKATRDRSVGFYSAQSISISIQHGNAASPLRTLRIRFYNEMEESHKDYPRPYVILPWL